MRRRPLLPLLALMAAASAACSSDSATIAGPSPVKCALTATLGASTMDASGGAGSIAVVTTPECTWSAAAEAPWVTGLSPASGQGSGQVDFRVATNNTAAARETDIVINNERVRVRQNGAACRVEVSPTAHQMSANGGGVTLAVTTLSGCTWTATSDVPWITVAGAGSGSGSGSLDVQVAANDSETRVGTVRVGDQTVTITQAAASACSYAITPDAQSFPIGGGASGPVSVTATPGCTWSATSTVPWVTIAAGHAGSGNGTVSFTVAANTGSGRTATLSIAGHSFLVSQAGVANCAYTIAPSNHSIGASGGSGPPISVATTAACSWSASSNVSWLRIVAGATGIGPGSVAFEVDANTGSARTGTLSVAGQTFTVSQAAGSCGYSVSPAAASLAADGGSGTFALTTGPACSWTAAANAPWITITSAASGSGPATIAFTIAANTGGARNGAITIGDQTFTVSQSAAGAPPCAFTLNSTSQSMPAAGGTGSFGLTTSSTCTWTATSGASWITITSGSNGTGTGSVGFSVAVNTGGQRSGAITAGGQTFTITQAAAPASCNPTIAPASESVPAAGRSGISVTVSAAAGCTWTAASGASWITVASGATGSGDGTVTLNVAANSGPARTGTVTIAGQTFTITQAAAQPSCNPTIAPSSQSVAAAGASAVSVTVSAPSSCTWTATSGESWISITSGASGTGDGNVVLSVAANNGAARTGTVTIAGRTFTVNQAGCTYAINPTSQTLSAAGGTGSVAVTAAGGCDWTATSNASWIAITSGQSGSSNGTVAFTVIPNTGAARTGTITIAGQTFTVTQEAALPVCVYTITPTSATFNANGGDGSIDVTTSSGCGWSVGQQRPDFITITSGESGNGPGRVTYTVRQHNGRDTRSGTFTVAGQTFTVTQTGR